MIFITSTVPSIENMTKHNKKETHINIHRRSAYLCEIVCLGKN